MRRQSGRKPERLPSSFHFFFLLQVYFFFLLGGRGGGGGGSLEKCAACFHTFPPQIKHSRGKINTLPPHRAGAPSPDSAPQGPIRSVCRARARRELSHTRQNSKQTAEMKSSDQHWWLNELTRPNGPALYCHLAATGLDSDV